jgi:outer membrane immunogenic protein
MESTIEGVRRMNANPRTVSLAAAISLLGVGFASAADVYTPPPPSEEPASMPAPAPIVSWQGFYGGIHGGYGWGDAESSTAADVELDGALAGGQIGYNWQLARVVVGIEADISWSGMDGAVSVPATTHELDWLGTVRGRIGLPMGRTLPYVTGGFAFGEATRTVPGASASASHTGFTAGAGIERALSDRASAKLEYQYVDLGDETYSLPGAPVADLKAHTVRLGLNFRFWGP